MENAVRHTPDFTNIIVRVGECGIQVEDRRDVLRAVSGHRIQNSDGLGIGLSIVERFAELHNGSLRHSVSRHGHIFNLVLPVR
ncbi:MULTISPECIES: ATP-binding protein [Rhizobium]|uniref:ATP-binding protein n=1 Tax=Rhizobium TaxID=379 RepID=UPI00359F802B